MAAPNPYPAFDPKHHAFERARFAHEQKEDREQRVVFESILARIGSAQSPMDVANLKVSIAMLPSSLEQTAKLQLATHVLRLVADRRHHPSELSALANAVLA